MKILFITRYFPPEASGGARRPRALINILRKMGHDVWVAGPQGIDDQQIIIAAHPNFPAKIYSETRLQEASSAPSFSEKLRLYFMLPDTEISWALRLERAILASKQRFDIVISTNPPESLHLIASRLKDKLGTKWIADLRDPWIFPPQRKILENPIRRFIETFIAKYIFKKCDGIIAVSDSVMKDTYSYAATNIMRDIIGHIAEKYDGPAFEFPSETFNIVHTGSISFSNPLTEFAPLLDEFSHLVEMRKDARLYLVGRLSQDELTQIGAFKYKDYIHVLGQKPREIARAMQLGADALVVVSGKNSHALPGKFSEYQLTGRPILLVGQGEWCKLIPKNAFTMDFAASATLEKGQARQNEVWDDDVSQILRRILA